MDKVKMMLVLVLHLVIMSSFSGCYSDQLNRTTDADISDNLQLETAEQIDFDFDALLSFIAMTDGNIIYQNVDTNGVYYMLTTAEGTQEELGCTENFLLSMKQAVLDSPYLYFFVSVLNEKQDGPENILVRINIDDQKTEMFHHKDDSIPGISTYMFNGQILTLKNVVKENLIKTYIESFDLNSSSWEKHMECSFDEESGQGEAVFGICSNQSNLFVLHDFCHSSDKRETYLEVLNKQYQIEKSIKIDTQMHDYVLTSFISDMQAFGNYIYIYNASNYGYLAKIENDELKEVYKGRNFEIATNVVSSPPLLYTRRTNTLYSIDSMGNIIETNLHVGNDYVLMTALVDDDSYFLVFFKDDAPTYAYFVNRNNIEHTLFPCGS